MHIAEPTPVRIRSRALRTVVMALLGIVALALGQSVLAHHGWAWAEDAQSTLVGRIQSISMSAPHPTLQVTDAAGAVWQVDLGNPSQTERSGFKGDTAKAGDAITVLGNRNRDHERQHMKAVRITLAGRNFDLYPERLPQN